MSEQETAERLCEEIAKREAECERGVVAIRGDGQAGIAVTNPNSLMLAVALISPVFIFDFYLN